MISKREPPKLQGYLYKEGGIYKSWKRRWFVVDGDTLKYYVNESKEMLKGSINISSITSVKPLPAPQNSKNSSTSALSFSLTGSTSNLHHLNATNGRPLSSSIHNIPIDSVAALNSSTNNIGGSSHSSGISSSSSNFSTITGGVSSSGQNNNIGVGGNTSTTTSINTNNTSSSSSTTLKDSQHNNSSISNNNNNNNNNKDNNSENHLNNILNTIQSSIDPHHQDNHHHHGWVFIITTTPRTYTLRAMNEGEMYYWIQGLRSIQVDSHIISFTNAQKERKSRTLSRQSLELDPESLACSQQLIKQELTGLHYQISEMKQHHSEMKSECKIAIQDFRNLLSIIHEQFRRYNMEVENSKRKLIQQHHPSNNNNNYINNSSNNICNNSQIGISSSSSNNNNNNNQNNNNNNPSNNNNNNNNGLIISQSQTIEMYKINNNNNNNNISGNNQGYPVAPNGMVLWYPDNSTTTCFSCKQGFTFFKRRHHCRNCGRLFCSQCSDHQAIAQGYQHNVRVCVQCAKDIWTSSGIRSSKMTTNFLTFHSTGSS